jgi:hypothetical protein
MVKPRIREKQTNTIEAMGTNKHNRSNGYKVRGRHRKNFRK